MFCFILFCFVLFSHSCSHYLQLFWSPRRENLSLLPLSPLLFAMKWWDQRPWVSLPTCFNTCVLTPGCGEGNCEVFCRHQTRSIDNWFSKYLNIPDGFQGRMFEGKGRERVAGCVISSGNILWLVDGEVTGINLFNPQAPASFRGTCSWSLCR